MQPARPLTIAEYERLPEDTDIRWELQEGCLVMSPSVKPRHMFALARLVEQMTSQLPVSLVDCHLAGEFGYQDNGGVSGEFTTSVPFPLRIDLNRLIRRT